MFLLTPQSSSTFVTTTKDDDRTTRGGDTTSVLTTKTKTRPSTTSQRLTSVTPRRRKPDPKVLKKKTTLPISTIHSTTVKISTQITRQASQTTLVPTPQTFTSTAAPDSSESPTTSITTDHLYSSVGVVTKTTINIDSTYTSSSDPHASAYHSFFSHTNNLIMVLVAVSAGTLVMITVTVILVCVKRKIACKRCCSKLVCIKKKKKSRHVNLQLDDITDRFHHLSLSNIDSDDSREIYSVTDTTPPRRDSSVRQRSRSRDTVL